MLTKIGAGYIRGESEQLLSLPKITTEETEDILLCKAVETAVFSKQRLVFANQQSIAQLGKSKEDFKK